MLELIRKGSSRCFVFFEEHIEKVKEIIKEVDCHEYEYIPKDWIALWNDNPEDQVYNGKFDINVVNLYRECGRKGIAIMIVADGMPDCYIH